MVGRMSDTARELPARIVRNLKDCVRIDTRSLAVFRVFVGLLIVADLLLRSRNFSFFYTEEGVVPQSLAMDRTADYAFSFYYLTTDSTVIAALFLVQGLVALQLIVGYKTRVATILSFLFVVSLDHHNPLVLSYADTLFRLLLFWAIFLPLGERWSVDAVHSDRTPRQSVTGVATALILSQMVYMYFLNGYHKIEEQLWTSGEAAPLVMGLDDMTFLLAGYVREFPALLEIGGLLWFYMLLGSWLLIVLVGRPRILAVAAFVMAHASFAITVRIGAFAFVAIAALVLFLQTQFWEDLERIVRHAGLDGSRLEARVSGIERVARRVPNPRLRHETYDRAKSGLYTVSIGVIVLSLVLFGIITYLPVGAIDEESTGPAQIETAAESLNVDQPPWTVFAPTPRTTDRYYVFAAETADGETLDVYNDRELTFERPYDELQKQYGTYRERFYMGSVRSGGVNEHHDAPVILADHLCDTWASEHDTELTHITMYRASEDVTMETISDHEERDRWVSSFYEHGCGDNEPKSVGNPDI